jgi:hypothetical protein
MGHGTLAYGDPAVSARQQSGIPGYECGQITVLMITMKTLIAVSILVAILFAAISAAPAAQSTQPMLSHNVFFKLKDPSASSKQGLVDACKKYLSDHPGTTWFAAGVLADEFDREVNDRDFDVALHVVFANREAHDQYQTAPKHLQFIQENKDHWKSVRVFDSWVNP